MRTFYEFFAGGGMARAGLAPEWTCLFANDIDPRKGATYAANWGEAVLRICDVADIASSDLPGHADLAWASFPCEDLSVAGRGAGLGGRRSGAFWPFWMLVEGLAEERRAPRIVVLENVRGLLTCREGRDFALLCGALASAGYRPGATVIDAVHFVPQSRPRLFVVAVRGQVSPPTALVADGPVAPWHPPALVRAYMRLPAETRAAWLWWNLPRPPRRSVTLADVVEEEPHDVAWHNERETRRILELMSPVHRDRVRAAQASGNRVVGTICRRTRRRGSDGTKVQRAEVRLDGIAGCLRTPGGGSSLQTLLVAGNGTLRTRPLTPREGARLMGLPDSYVLPAGYRDAFHLLGDGVVVPVVRFLSDNLLLPLADAG